MNDDDWPDFNDLWDYDDPAGTEARFRELLPAAERAGDASYHLQLLAQIDWAAEDTARMERPKSLAE